MNKLRGSIERDAMQLYKMGKDKMPKREVIDSFMHNVSKALETWLNEEAKGWVVGVECPIYLDHGEDYAGRCLAGTQGECDNLCNEDGLIERPATHAEVLAGKATWVGEK